ncbi:hydroxymethylpyrimidine/phosphomethylpyrimidine kinase [Prevotella corporis]|uniref:hydroxymethylpyrimidine/phosphomethylpyrimidine kinase n=1 Tax=Prevotella corporis TaxID=28128 RepID=UPI002365C18F|nr:hydroxymethylpyrimidine/phosphomethylpyrimidine kinase [Prevotella corporis]
MEKKITILTITGSDSTGGSGVQADIKTITALGAYAATAITTVTAQDTEGIQQLYDIPSEVLDMQIRAVMNDLQPDAIKVGMLRTVEQVRVVERLLREYRPKFIVLDAVVISSRGNMLMPKEVVAAMVRLLFPLTTVVAIKQDSISYMLRGNEIRSNEELEMMARKLMMWGCRSVVLQGGAIASQSLTDVLVQANPSTVNFYTRPGFIDRITHGAGGAFTSAMAVYLCMGARLETSVEQAQEYMSQLILRSADSKLGTASRLLDHSSQLSRQNITARILELYNQLMDEIASHHQSTKEVSFYANRLSVTPRYLAQVTHRVAGRTPKQLIDDYIIKEVETQLIGTTKNIQEIAFGFGFSSQVQFNKFFRKMKGCSPTQFRKAATPT